MIETIDKQGKYRLAVTYGGQEFSYGKVLFLLGENYRRDIMDMLDAANRWPLPGCRFGVVEAGGGTVEWPAEPTTVEMMDAGIIPPVRAYIERALEILEYSISVL